MNGWEEKHRDDGLKSFDALCMSVLDESSEQLTKWGHQEHTWAEWSVILGEEVGELMKELCELHFRKDGVIMSTANASNEAIQIATLALKIAEMLGAHGGP